MTYNNPDMMSEEEFLQHIDATDEMTEDEFLEHFGVKGMKWGKSSGGAAASGGKTKSELRTADKASRQADRATFKSARKKDAADIDTEIDAARGRIKSGENRQKFKDAKATYSEQKMVVGKREAKKALNAVKSELYTDAAVADLAKSGKETTKAIVSGIAGMVILGAIAGLRG